MKNKGLQRLAIPFLICAFLPFLSACRSFRGQEPEQGALVAAIGIDADGEKNIRVALEVLVPRDGDEADRRILQGFGATVSDAYRDALTGFPRAPLFGHCAVLIFGNGVSDTVFKAVLAERSLPPEMQAVTSPNALTLLQTEKLSTPALGYDLQTILADHRDIHCRIYELTAQAEEIRRDSLPHFEPAPDGSGKAVIVGSTTESVSPKEDAA